jgi:pimeloyl-ACP methyl ester carboxylesterase
VTRRRKHLLILAAVLVALIAVAFTLGSPAQGASPTPGAASAGSPSTPRLQWGACPDGGGRAGMQCATLTVPVDPDQPGGRTIDLKVGRLRATGTDPVGSVLVNFGGPGPSGITMLRDHFAGAFTELREWMHLVTWDPRGYGGEFGGRSTALGCDWRSMVRPRTPAFPRSQAEFDQLVAANRALAEPCRATDPALFDHMDSASHAHDMEAIRQALGEQRLNYYGASYGGVFGQAYARLFPDRLRTMVLDGTGNHATNDWDAELDAIARDSQATFQRFVDWCAATRSCALHGSDLTARWQHLVARADQTPIPARRAGAGVAYTGRELQTLAVSTAMRGQQGWPGLARAIRAAEHGDASGFRPPGQPSPYPMVGTPGVTECLDFPRFHDHAHLAATVQRLRTVAPDTGASFPLAAHTPTCSGWPAPVTNPPAPLPEGVPPLLGAGTWTDFPGTARAIQQVAGSRSIYHDGPGHVLYASGNTCAIQHVNRYLATTKLPPPGTRCP